MTEGATVFVSYAHDDAARCAALMKWLDAWGVQYWFEARSDDTGQLSQNTQMALSNAAIFLRICTPAANRSYWMSLEMGAFLSTQADEHRRGVASNRSLVSLILDPGYQRQPFDHAGAIVDATNKPQTAWLNDLRAAFGMPPLTGEQPAPVKVEVPVTTVTMSRRRAIGAGIAATAALAVAGSTGLLLVDRKQSVSPVGQATTSPKPTPQPKPAVVDPNLKWYFKTGDTIYARPAVANGVVYFGSDDQRAYALDAQTGAVKWDDPGNVRLERSPVIGATHVFFEANTVIVGLDLANGNQSWTYNLAIRTPAVANGIVYIGLLSGVDAYLERDSNTRVWTADTSNSPVLSMVSVKNTLYTGTENGQVFAFDTSNANPNAAADVVASKGQRLWSYQTGGKVQSHATEANGVVYVGSDDHYLHAIDAQSGQRRWAFKTGDMVQSTPVALNGVVYFASNDNVLYAVDGSTGKLVWTFQTDAKDELSSAESYNDKIYIASSSQYLYVLDLTNGSVLHKYQAGGKLSASPAIANGLVYVGCQDHYLYAFNAV